MAHDVFISHSSLNKSAADAICHALENRGIKCWIAPRDVIPGAEYAEGIMNGIEYCTVFLLVLSKEANESKNVSKEIENAFHYGKKVIPFFLESVTIRKALEYYLRNLHWLFADPDDTGFDGLAEEVRRALGASPAALAKSKTAPEPAPAPPKTLCGQLDDDTLAQLKSLENDFIAHYKSHGNDTASGQLSGTYVHCYDDGCVQSFTFINGKGLFIDIYPNRDGTQIKTPSTFDYEIKDDCLYRYYKTGKPEVFTIGKDGETIVDTDDDTFYKLPFADMPKKPLQ